MVVSELGNSMVVRDEQELKAPSPIAVNDDGNSMVVSDEQPLKAQSPIVVSELGNFIYFSDEQSLNASLPIAETWYSIPSYSTDAGITISPEYLLPS